MTSSMRSLMLFLSALMAATLLPIAVNAQYSWNPGLKKSLTESHTVFQDGVSQEEHAYYRPYFMFDVELGASIPTGQKVRSDFPVGVNLSLGPKWSIPAHDRLWIKASLGLKWHFTEIPEGYTEHIVSYRLGPALEYEAFYWGNVVLSPVFKVDVVHTRNYDREGSFSEYYDENVDTPIAARYLRGWGLSKEVGLKTQVGRYLFVYVGYEDFRPRMKVLNQEFQGRLGEGNEGRSHRTFDLSMVNISLGINLNNL